MRAADSPIAARFEVVWIGQGVLHSWRVPLFTGEPLTPTVGRL